MWPTFPAAVLTHPYLTFAILIPLLTLGIILVKDFTIYLHLPPGPTPIPFYGNTHQIPKTQPWLQFQKWSQIYGPIFTLWIGRKPTLVISDPQIAVDLLEKRSNKYSSRPRMVLLGEIFNNNASILTQPYGKSWSIRRKLLHQALNPRALKGYMKTQEAEASRMCWSLLQKGGEGWEKELERFTSSVVFCVAYGRRIDDLNAKVIRERFKFMGYAASLNVPGKYLAESFPILAKLPFQRWKRAVEAMGTEQGMANLRLMNVVRRDLEEKEKEKKKGGGEKYVPESLCRLVLETKKQEGIPLSDLQLSYVPASLFGAGSDTTASTLCSALLALITHPSVLQRAQTELDTVIGPHRLPTFSDEAHLPYIRALCKETLRWRPVAVLGGTPHASTEDDVYRSYRIPAHTTILSNSWAINLHEAYYPNPHRFDPGRFLSSRDVLHSRGEGVGEGIISGEKQHPSPSGHSSFGWGRRICPGAGLAENSLFIALARLLWTFDILPIPGREYDIFAYTDGFNIRPQKFECVIQQRSRLHAEVLEREMGSAREWLEGFRPFEE